MIFRSEKILLVLLIAVFGLLPIIAYPLFPGITGTPTDGPEKNTETFIASSAFEQLAAVATAFVIKPLYTLIALAIAIILWNKKELELKAFKWCPAMDTRAREANERFKYLPQCNPISAPRNVVSFPAQLTHISHPQGHIFGIEKFGQRDNIFARNTSHFFKLGCCDFSIILEKCHQFLF